MSRSAATRLKARAPEPAPQGRGKILVYGRSGVGKTWGSLQFPTVYYVDTEGGARLPHYQRMLQESGGLYLSPEDGANDFAVVLDQVRALAEERHPYRTLVIDSVSKLFNDAIAREADRLASEGKKDEYGASKKPAVSAMRRLVFWLGRVDMNCILIAHAKDEYALVGSERQAVGTTYDGWDRLEYELDLCLRVEQRGPSRVAVVRKSRLEGFPQASSLPWSYDEFASRYGRETLEAAAQPVEAATPGQVAELASLLERVRMPDDWLAKCLARAGAEAPADLTAEQISKLISAAKEKLSAVPA
jgi:AAA domain